MPRFLNAVLAKDTTDCTGANTGSLQSSGGLWVAKQIRSDGIANFLNTTPSTSYTNGAIITPGGIGCGTLAVNAVPILPSQTAKTFFAAPNGSAGAPSFRTLAPTDYPVFVGSGASHAIGAVPDPGVTAGTTKYLREDGTWVVPPGTGLTNPMTTLGDLIVGGTSGTPARLAIGTEGRVLTSQGGNPAWVTLPSAGAATLSSVTLADNTTATLVPGAAFPTASTSALKIDFWATRGATLVYCGYITITYDGTHPRALIHEDQAVGDMGLTFGIDVNGGNVRLLYTTTNTGVAVAFKYLVNSGAVLGAVSTVRSTTADTTLTFSDQTLYVDTTTGAVTVYLPSAPYAGLTYNIKKACISANSMTIDGNGKQIDGAYTVSTVATNRPNYMLQYDGTSWNLL